MILKEGTDMPEEPKAPEYEPKEYSWIEMPADNDIWRRDKGRLDHATHEQVTDPTDILTVGFVSFLWFGVLGMSKGHLTGSLKCIEHRDPVLAGRFHADFGAIVFLKPRRQPS